MIYIWLKFSQKMLVFSSIEEFTDCVGELGRDLVSDEVVCIHKEPNTEQWKF